MLDVTLLASILALDQVELPIEGDGGKTAWMEYSDGTEQCTDTYAGFGADSAARMANVGGDWTCPQVAAQDDDWRFATSA